jgi:hypothetical protein
MVTARGNFWRGPLIRLFKSIVLLRACHASHFKTPTLHEFQKMWILVIERPITNDLSCFPFIMVVSLLLLSATSTGSPLSSCIYTVNHERCFLLSCNTVHQTTGSPLSSSTYVPPITTDVSCFHFTRRGPNYRESSSSLFCSLFHSASSAERHHHGTTPFYFLG